jgi:hypothetical protein
MREVLKVNTRPVAASAYTEPTVKPITRKGRKSLILVWFRTDDAAAYTGAGRITEV